MLKFSMSSLILNKIGVVRSYYVYFINKCIHFTTHVSFKQKKFDRLLMYNNLFDRNIII